jgi:hypothetical protein
VCCNSALTSLTGLEGLTSIGGGLDVESNPILTSLSALNALNSIGEYIWISGNETLNSLTGLDKIDADSITDLEIYNNPFLSTCAVQSICDYLASPNGYIYIYDNATGCNSPEEVDSACVYLSNGEINLEPSFSICPNPSSSTITIELPTATPQKNKFLTIYNLNGQQLITRQITEPTTVIDVGTLPCGVYVVKVADERTVMVTKFIKSDR